MARTRVRRGTLGTAFRRELQAVDENMLVSALRTLEERIAPHSWAQPIFGTLFAIFAGIAPPLALVGLYAVIARSVGQRTRRSACRWHRTLPNILQLSFPQGIKQLVIGLAIGCAAWFGLTRVLNSLLVQVA